MVATSIDPVERLEAALGVGTRAPSKRMLVIVNPYATTVSDRLKNLVVYALRGSYQVDAIDTEARDHATELCREAAREGYDVVYGIRVKRDASIFLKVAYKAFYRVFRSASYVPIPLDAGDFSLIDRRVVDTLNRLPETNRFLRGLRAWVGYRQTGVPYVRPERMFGRTTNNLVRNLGWARKAIFSFSYAPLDLLIWFGLATVGLSFVGIVFQIVLRLLHPDLAPNGFSTLIVLILFIGGVQLLSLSVIGSYLAHIYDEVKRRPPFIVESVLNDPTRNRGAVTPVGESAKPLQ